MSIQFSGRRGRRDHPAVSADERLGQFADRAERPEGGKHLVRRARATIGAGAGIAAFAVRDHDRSRSYATVSRPRRCRPSGLTPLVEMDGAIEPRLQRSIAMSPDSTRCERFLCLRRYPRPSLRCGALVISAAVYGIELW